MAQIFLCHASEDKSQVREVYRHLQEEDFHPWLDEENLVDGQLWEQEIPKALRASDFILIFFSQNSMRKIGYVQNEFKLALETWRLMPGGMIHTIPVRLDNCEIPEEFRKFHWVNLFQEDSYEGLLRAIRMGLEQRSGQEDDGTYNYLIVHETDPRYTGNPDWAIWGTWEYHVLTESGNGNLVRPKYFIP